MSLRVKGSPLNVFEEKRSARTSKHGIEYSDENDAYSDDDLYSLLMRSIIFRHRS